MPDATPSRRQTLAGALAVLLLIAGCPGCLTNPTGLPSALPDREARLARGYVFYFDGAGGGTEKSNYAAGVAQGMIEAGYDGAGEVVSWETGKGLMADQDASVAYKRSRAAEGARNVQLYQQARPGAPVSLLGFSAGTAEAIFALEALPETVSVEYVVLLGTSISHDYDLTEALKRVRKTLYIFTSSHDHMLGTAMPLSGTADRKFFDAGAGIHGFSLPKHATDETRRLYAARIVTIPYNKEFSKDGDHGHHFDNVKKDFIRDYVAPLIMGRPVPERLKPTRFGAPAAPAAPQPAPAPIVPPFPTPTPAPAPLPPQP